MHIHLIDFIAPREERVQGSDLEQNAASAPKVHLWTVEAIRGEEDSGGEYRTGQDRTG